MLSATRNEHLAQTGPKKKKTHPGTERTESESLPGGADPQSPLIIQQGRQTARREALRVDGTAGKQLHPSADTLRKAKGLRFT